MYSPRHFAELDRTVLRDEIRKIRAGHLITLGSEGLEASFIPLLISDDAGMITGHLAKGNEQWRHADTSVPALITWIGPDAYVSPSYYPSKREHQKVVPTWNYITVQAKGLLSFREDDQWKRSHLEALTNFHERAMVEPWAVSDAPNEFIEGLMQAIVGVSIQVASIEGKWKLSQNKSDSDVAGVVAGFKTQGTESAEKLIQKMTIGVERNA